MLKKVLFIFLLLTTTIVLNTHSQSIKGLPFSRYFSSLDYEGGIQNWNITQNKEGILYVANNFGLLEYDGTDWKIYTVPGQTKLRDVTISNDGKVFVASQGSFGYFNPVDTGMVYVSLADSLPDKVSNFDETWRIFQNRNTLYICTFDYLYVFEDYSFKKAYSYPSHPEDFHFVNNKLFISLEDDGLATLDDGEIIMFNGGEKFAGQTVSFVLPLVNNHLLIGTVNNGIWIYNGSSYLTWNKEYDAIYRASNINSGLRLRNGDVALGTQNQGVLLADINGNIQQQLNKGKGLNNRTVLSLYQDISGNLWLGHNNGITMLELELPFSLINEQIGLPGTGYDGILFSDNVYLATNNGVYVKDIKAYQEQYNFVDETEGQAYHFNIIDNQLLLGHHRGSFELENKEAQQIANIPGSWTFLSLKKFPGYIISGNYNGLLLYKDTPTGYNFVRKIKGFEESSRIMEQDQEGNIWMTHGYKGVFKLKLNQALDSVSVKYYGPEDGFPSKNLINVWKIDNRLLFTTESGIYQYDQKLDKFVPDNTFKDILANDIEISILKEDALGNTYYISPDEIGRLQKLPNNKYQKENKVFNRLKGILNDDLQNLSIINSETILYGAKEGFIIYNPSTGPGPDIQLNTLIRSVKVSSPIDSIIMSGYYNSDDGISIDQGESHIAELPYSHNSILFSYSAPFFNGTDQTTYQYMLEGLDEKWSKWTLKTEKEYTNLHEGDYLFKVRAKNVYDQVGEIATYSFTIAPPWYRSKLAIFLYLTGTLGILGLSFYFMKSKYDREKKMLHIKQEVEINRMDSELKSSEEKIEHLRAQKLKAEVDSKDKQLATSTMHLVNKNSFITSVKQDISTILKRSKNQEVKKELNKIVTNINKNITEDEDWDEFAIHFDQVHGDFTKRIKEDYPDLTPQEMKLSAYLRMNLSTKEIAHLLNISVRGVEIARYRLRKKLELERADNLQDFILNY